MAGFSRRFRRCLVLYVGQTMRPCWPRWQQHVEAVLLEMSFLYTMMRLTNICHWVMLPLERVSLGPGPGGFATEAQFAAVAVARGELWVQQLEARRCDDGRVWGGLNSRDEAAPPPPQVPPTPPLLLYISLLVQPLQDLARALRELCHQHAGLSFALQRPPTFHLPRNSSDRQSARAAARPPALALGHRWCVHAFPPFCSFWNSLGPTDRPTERPTKRKIVDPLITSPRSPTNQNMKPVRPTRSQNLYAMNES